VGLKSQLSHLTGEREKLAKLPVAAARSPPGTPSVEKKRKPYCQHSGSELILILLAERRHGLLQVIKNFKKAQHTHQF
jgi:hypothetical protein